MTKICPNCGKENEDNALSCSNCGYIFPNAQNSTNTSPIPENPESQPNYPSQSKFPKKILGIAVVVVIAIAAIFFIPYFFHHSSTITSAAQTAYGGKWTINTTYSGTEIINSNNTASIKFMNGTFEIIPFNSTGLAGTKVNLYLLTQNNSTKYIEITNITFTNYSIASKYYSSVSSSFAQEASLVGMSLNNATYQNYKIVYIKGGIINTTYGEYPVPSIAYAIHGSNVISLNINGFTSNLNQIEDLLRSLI
jgi:hypothetical protein